MDLNEEMKNAISKINNKPKLLLHACCAPCCSAVLEKLHKFFSITIFYYNPNIMPKEEWEKRKNEFNKLYKICNFEFISPPYDNQNYLSFAQPLKNDLEGGRRCELCIQHRLKVSFNFAKENHFNYFCSTLSISPHKNATLINQIGKSLEDETTKWLPNDFKKENGFLRSIKLCQELNVYRQTYCGCKF